MKILQRYILFELLKVFGLLVTVLTVMLVFVGVFQEAQQKGLGPAQIVQILPYLIPSLLPYTIPSTLLLAVCVVYGRLSGDLEVIATKSAGINPLQLLMPAFLLSIVLSIGSLVLTDQIIPWAIARMQYTISQALEDIFLDQLRSTHLISEPSQGYTIQVMDVRGKKLISPTFQLSRGKDTPITVQAQEATFNFDLKNEEVVLNLKKCQISADDETTFFVEEEKHPIPLPEQISRINARHLSLDAIHQKLEEMDQTQEQEILKREMKATFRLITGEFDQLGNVGTHQFAQKIKENERTRHKLSTEMYTRYAFSTSCFFFVILGAPYSISQAKKQFLTTFFLCFLPILLMYYPLALLILTLCKNGEIDPTWTVWIPNLVLMIAGLVILRRVLKH
ncbi:MAG: YjgP/YjgQ family permease [Planctomycetaceae bacterium]|nr:YjgP/YjgQ family permease [Planctomycetaceae bacterium]